MNENLFNEWIQKAEEDYEAAISLSRKKLKPTPNVVGFHCQQCIEKYMKAFLIFKGYSTPKIHDLLELHKTCLVIEPNFIHITDMLDELNPYAVEYRYPGEMITVEEAKFAVKVMKRCRELIKKLLPAD